jgi:DtxR family transcriptional regulator, Mn-dependent transcriptional regulator
MHKSPMEERIEELLELMWVLREDGTRGRAELEAAAPEAGESAPREVLTELATRKLVRESGSELLMTPAGESIAESIVRRNRLAERLLSDVLEVDMETMTEEACRFEHVLSPGVTRSICTLLGHPLTCPHGRPIPRGECCGTYETELEPIVMRLADLGVGDQARVTLVSSRMDGLERLGTLGLVPGTTVRLVQRRPSYVVDVGETTIAIDTALARAIFVRRQ